MGCWWMRSSCSNWRVVMVVMMDEVGSRLGQEVRLPSSNTQLVMRSEPARLVTVDVDAQPHHPLDCDRCCGVCVALLKRWLLRYPSTSIARSARTPTTTRPSSHFNAFLDFKGASNLVVLTSVQT